MAALPIAAPPPNERTWSQPRKFFYLNCTIYYVLNSMVSDPNLTKFLQDVQKWFLITNLKSKLRDSNPFWHVIVTNEDQSSNCVRIAAKIAHFNSINSEIVGQKFTKLVYDIDRLSSFNLLKAYLWSANPLSNAEAKSKGRSWRRLRTSPNLTGCHSNVPWETAKRIFG